MAVARYELCQLGLFACRFDNNNVLSILESNYNWLAGWLAGWLGDWLGDRSQLVAAGQKGERSEVQCEGGLSQAQARESVSHSESHRVQ